MINLRELIECFFFFLLFPHFNLLLDGMLDHPNLGISFYFDAALNFISHGTK